MVRVARNFSLIFLLSSSLSADCLVDYSVMYLIAKQEMHKKRDVGYPYLISFNTQDDASNVQKQLNLNWLDKRTIDCNDLNNCEKVLESINKLNIENLDLGPYQINQKWYSFDDKNEYFNLEKSYNNACEIVYGHYKETGKWDWNTIARYHSKTPSHNTKYAEQLKKLYAKLKEEKKGDKS